jgi:hypothetical protein
MANASVQEDVRVKKVEYLRISVSSARELRRSIPLKLETRTAVKGAKTMAVSGNPF